MSDLKEVTALVITKDEVLIHTVTLTYWQNTQGTDGKIAGGNPRSALTRCDK